MEIAEIIKTALKNNGMTFNLKRGNLSGKRFYAVSTFKDKEKIIPVAEFTITAINEYLKMNIAELKKNGNSLGTWISGKNRRARVYLDITKTVGKLETAKLLAKENKQLAIYDLKKGEEIKIL